MKTGCGVFFFQSLLPFSFPFLLQAMKRRLHDLAMFFEWRMPLRGQITVLSLNTTAGPILQGIWPSSRKEKGHRYAALSIAIVANRSS